MQKLFLFLAFCTCLTANSIQGQSFAYSTLDVVLNEIPVPAFPGVHSGAWAKWNGHWIFLGGRTNGLHGFLPPLAFPTSGIMDEVWIMNPATGSMQTAQMDSVPQGIFEAVCSANMQFHQEDSMLYMIGGYGWCDTAAAFRTFPTLTEIFLPQLYDSVFAGGDISPAFRQVTDQRLAVCGAHLGKLGNRYILPFGHRFDGMYDEVDSTGFFVQDYTYQIRSFEIADTGGVPGIFNYHAVTDSANFRRRDYNMLYQIDSNQNAFLKVFGGVFQESNNLPWVHPITISDTGFSYQIQTNFSQQFAHYHSGAIAYVDPQYGATGGTFLGGMAQFYKDSATSQVIEDTLIPFVKTISQVVDGYNMPGAWEHTNISQPQMPGYLGTNAYFIPVEGSNYYFDPYPVVNMDNVGQGGNQLIGYCVGGIESPDPNISDTDPSLSFASPRIFEVLARTVIIHTEKPNLGEFSLRVGPNPTSDEVMIEIQMPGSQPCKLVMTNMEGKQIGEKTVFGKKVSERWSLKNEPAGVYFLTLTDGLIKITEKVVKVE